MNKKFTVNSLSVVLCTALFLNGCGGGSSGGATDSGVTLSGNVADGYLVGAKVCVDRNQNNVCDTDEPYAITISNGKYSFSNLLPSDLEKPLVAIITADVIDEDDNLTVDGTYYLKAPAGVKFVSPLTTMVKQHMEDNNVSLTSAKNSVATELGVSATMLTTDYIKVNTQDSIDAHKAAKIIANVKKEIASLLETEMEAHDRVDVASYVDKKVAQQLATIKTQTFSTQLPLASNISNVMSTINLGTFATDINTIKNDRVAKQEQAANTIVANSTNVEQITTSATLKENQKYTFVYGGGTVLRTFSVENSKNKDCRVNIFDTTNTSNSYQGVSATYLFDGESTTAQTYDFSGSTSENAKFLLGWTYGTAVNSNLDFSVSCQDKPVVTPTTLWTNLTTRTGLNVPSFSSFANDTSFIPFNVSGLGKIDDNRTFYFNTSSSINTLGIASAFYSGFVVQFNNMPLKSYESETLSVNNIKTVNINFDPIGYRVTVSIIGANQQVLDTFTETLSKPSIKPNTYTFGVTVVKKVNETDTTITRQISSLSPLK